MKQQLRTVILLSFLGLLWIGCSCLHRQGCRYAVVYSETDPMISETAAVYPAPGYVVEEGMGFAANHDHAQYSWGDSAQYAGAWNNQAANMNSMSSAEYHRAGGSFADRPISGAEYAALNQPANTQGKIEQVYSKSGSGTSNVTNPSAAKTTNTYETKSKSTTEYSAVSSSTNPNAAATSTQTSTQKGSSSFSEYSKKVGTEQSSKSASSSTSNDAASSVAKTPSSSSNDAANKTSKLASTTYADNSGSSAKNTSQFVTKNEGYSSSSSSTKPADAYGAGRSFDSYNQPKDPNANVRGGYYNPNDPYNTKSVPTTVDYKDASKVPAVKGCKYPSTCEFSTGVSVKVKGVKACTLGAQYPIDIEVYAYVDVTDVVLTAALPDNATYISSKPEAKVSGKNLTWNLGNMSKGQTIVGQVVLKTEKEGENCACFTLRSTSGGCCSTLCAKPVLACEKTGPTEICLGEPINYTVTVANTGSYQAEDVVLTIVDANPENKGQKTPATFNLGTIEVGKAKKVDFPVRNAKRGKNCYTATATSSNANQASCELCTTVTACLLECRKEGPKVAVIGGKANYQIVVTNTGDKPIHEMVITDTAPAATTIVSATEGGNIQDKTITWKVKELKVGETLKFNAGLSCRVAGTFANRVSVNNKEGYTAVSEASTNWRGRAAIDINTSTSENSIFVGETTRYRIVVTNQGQETDTNLTVAMVLPDGLVPINASGASAAKINGQTVNFEPIFLGLRAKLEYFVTVKANSTGDLRPKVQVGSDTIQPPITQEESLIVN